MFSKFLMKLKKINTNDHNWLFKQLIKPIFKKQKFNYKNSFSFENGTVKNNTSIGYVSYDKKTALLENRNTLTLYNRYKFESFHSDFVEISQMTYFIFCYVFCPFNPIQNYKSSWQVFKNRASSQESIHNFLQESDDTFDLLFRLNNNNMPKGFENTIEVSRKKPPIHSTYALIVEKNGKEFKMMNYTVQCPICNSYISVILLEQDDKKYYKISVTENKEYSGLLKNIDDHDYLDFDLDQFSKYQHVSEFIATYSMLLVKAIEPSYDEDFLPTHQHKNLFDMIHC